jgi:hypothetical protein
MPKMNHDMRMTQAGQIQATEAAAQVEAEKQATTPKADLKVIEARDATQRIGRSSEAARDVEVDESRVVEQTWRDSENVTETTDNDQAGELRKGAERVADDTRQIDQSSFNDHQARAEQSVGEQGSRMLRESEQQLKAAFEEASAAQRNADAARSMAAGDDRTQQTPQPAALERAVEMAASDAHAQARTAQQTEDAARSAFLEELRQQQAALNGLDDTALERVLACGDYQQMRGQLVEEYGNQRLEQTARDMGPEYRFIRGDQIRDQNNQPLTDGMIVRAAPDDAQLYEVVAIAEAKAGRASRRELTASRESYSALSEANRAELQAAAIDDFLEQRGFGDPGGNKPRSATILRDHGAEIEAVMRDMHGADMGQLRKDFERLMPNAGENDVTIRIDGADARVRVSPLQTEIYGITPKDVATDVVFERLREKEPNIGTNSIHIEYGAAEIGTLAKGMQDAAARHQEAAAQQQANASAAAAVANQAPAVVNTYADELQRANELARLRLQQLLDLNEVMEDLE